MASIYDDSFLRQLIECGEFCLRKSPSPFAQWSQAMESEMGPSVRPYLETLWSILQEPKRDFLEIRYRLQAKNLDTTSLGPSSPRPTSPPAQEPAQPRARPGWKASKIDHAQKPTSEVPESWATIRQENASYKEAPEGLFSVEYANGPGPVLYAQGGLKFRANEAALRYYFAPILRHVSFKDLVGEAVFWVLLPSTAAIWVFPFVLRVGLWFGLWTTVLLHVACQFVVWKTYIKPLNYLVFFLGNRPLQFLGYVIFFFVYYVDGRLAEAWALVGWFLFVAFGLDHLLGLPLIPVFASLFPLPMSDQALRNVGWYYGRKHGLDVASWTMK